MSVFENIAPYLTHPLVLVGFSLVVLTGVLKAVLSTGSNGLFPQLPREDAASIISRLIRYVFILALLMIIGGYATQAFDISKSRANAGERLVALEQSSRMLAEEVSRLSALISESESTSVINEPGTKVSCGLVTGLSNLDSLQLKLSQSAPNASSFSPDMIRRSIQVYRDVAYRACEAYVNGAIDEDTYQMIRQQSQVTMAKINDIERIISSGNG